MQQDPWAEFRTSTTQQPQTPTQPISSGVNPSDQLAQQRFEYQQGQDALQNQVTALKIEREQEDLRQEQEERAKLEQSQAQGIEDTIYQLRNVVDAAKKARAKSNGFFATGFGATTAANIGGTSAADVEGLLQTIGANTAFDRLQKMRDESPTGGALGQVSEIELRLLRDSIASISQSQSDEQFRENMLKVEQSYQRVLDRLEGRPVDEDQSNASGDDEIKIPGGGLFVGDDGSGGPLLIVNTQGGIELLDDNGGYVDVSDGKVPDSVNPKAISLYRDVVGPDGQKILQEAASRGANAIPTGSEGLTLSQIGQGLAEGTGDVVQGIGDTIGIVADPLARTLSDALGYDSSQLRSTGTAIREDLGLPQSSEGVGRTAREFAAGALGFAGAARGAATATTNALSRNSLAQVGRTPIRDTVAGAGAGAGSQVGEDIGGTGGQVAGMLAGGLGGYAAANKLATSTARSQPNALLSASQRQNVDLLPADAGGPVAQAVTVGTRASPLSVAPVAKAAENQQQQFGQAARRAAASQGEVLDTEQAGEAIRRGAKNFLQQSQARGNRLYERAFEQSRGVKIKPNQTAQAAGEAIERMRQNPAATESDIKALEGFMSNIEGGVTIQGLRDARTALSQSVYNGNMRSSSDQAMWKGILSNVADDIDAGLRSVGRDDAANTFRVADRLWSERIEVIDQVLQPIIGKEGMKGGEQILQAVESAARGQSGGNARLSRILGAMPKEEAANVRATIADRIGRATPGAQDAQGEVFSANTFLTNWNKLTPQAKTSLFPTKQMRDDLNDLAKIAEGTKRSQAMANTSNTGIAVNSANLGLASVGAVTSLPLTILGAGGVYGTGKLMASPSFARMLARTSKMPPEAANRTFREQLALLATREPLLADDIAKLTNAINDNGQLAAQEDEPQN